MANQTQPKIVYLQHCGEDFEYISVNALLEFINKIENEPCSGVDDFVDQGRAGVANELLAFIKTKAEGR